MEEFLRSLRDDLYRQLLSVKVSNETVPEIAALSAQLNLIANLYELPKLVEAIKERQAAYQELVTQRIKSNED